MSSKTSGPLTYDPVTQSWVDTMDLGNKDNTLRNLEEEVEIRNRKVIEARHEAIEARHEAMAIKFKHQCIVKNNDIRETLKKAWSLKSVEEVEYKLGDYKILCLQAKSYVPDLPINTLYKFCSWICTKPRFVKFLVFKALWLIDYFGIGWQWPLTKLF